MFSYTDDRFAGGGTRIPMSNLSCFERVRVISLTTRSDRRNRVARELLKVGCRLGDSDIRFFDAFRPTNEAGFPSIGAHGCFMSHLAVLEEAERDGVETLLVLEDDAVFAADFLPEGLRFIRELSGARWDLAYLGHVEPAGVQSGRERCWVKHTGPLQTTHCYAVHKNAVPVLVKALHAMLHRPPGDPIGGPMHYDGALSTIRKQNPDLVTLVASPSLVDQGGSASDIAGRRWFDRVPVISYLAQRTRDAIASMMTR